MTEYVDYSDHKTWSMAKAREVAATVAVRAPQRAEAFAEASHSLPDQSMHVTGPPRLEMLRTALRAAVEMCRGTGPQAAADVDQPFPPLCGPDWPQNGHNWTEEAFAFWMGEMYRHEIPQLQWRVPENTRKSAINHRSPFDLHDPVTGRGYFISGRMHAPSQVVEGRFGATLESLFESERRWLEETRAACAAPAVSEQPMTLDELVPIVRERATGYSLFLDDYYRSLFEDNVDAASIAVALTVEGVTRARINDSDHLVVTGTASPRDVQLALARHAIEHGEFDEAEVGLDQG